MATENVAVLTPSSPDLTLKRRQFMSLVYVNQGFSVNLKRLLCL